MNILIYNEGVHDKADWMKKVYPDGIHGALKSALTKPENTIKITTLDDVHDLVTDEELRRTDVMLWWGHTAHDQVSDALTERIAKAVQCGMGMIFLHSAHLSKPFRALMGTSCTLRWRDDDRERVWVSAPAHPIAAGLGAYFELPNEEMYGEYFDIPKPDDVVFIGWFAGGEVFRSGVTFTRGLGRVFYFQPGHEAFPTYYNPEIIKILQNAADWCKPVKRVDKMTCPCVEKAEAERNEL